MKSNRIHCSLLTFILVAMIVMVMDARASAQNVYETDDGKKFEVRLVPSAKEIFLNERIGLTVEIRNLSDTPLLYKQPEVWLGAIHTPEFTMNITQPDGIKLPGAIWLRQSNWRNPPLKPRIFTIPPGGINAETVRMPNSGYFLVRGIHRFSIEYQLFIGTSDPLAKKPIATTDEISVNAIPPNPRKLGDLISRLGDAMLNADAKTAEAAADRLSGIHDPRGVVWFSRLLAQVEKKEKPDPYSLHDSRSILNRSMTYLLSAGTGEAEAVLKELRQSRSLTIRRASAFFYAERKHPDVIPILLQMARDPDPEVRFLAVNRLAREMNPKILATLSSMREDTDKTVREAVHRFFENWMPPDQSTHSPLQAGSPVSLRLKAGEVSFPVNHPATLLLEIHTDSGVFPEFFGPQRGTNSAQVKIIDRNENLVLNESELFLVASGQSGSDSQSFLATMVIPKLPAGAAPGTYRAIVETHLNFANAETRQSSGGAWVRVSVPIEYGAENWEIAGTVTKLGAAAIADETEAATGALRKLAAARERSAIPFLIHIAVLYADEFRSLDPFQTDGRQSKLARFEIVVRALTELNDERCRAVIPDLLNSPNFQIKFLTAEILRKSPSPTIRSLLSVLAPDSNPYLRELAARGLADSPEPEAEKALWRLFADKEESVKRTAMYGLEALRRKKLGY